MKIRLGFVSNSSVSSFLCAICDKLHSVMDGDPSSDPYSINTCKNSHSFCSEHILGSEDRKIELMKEALIISEKYNIEGIEDMSLKQLKQLFERDFSEDGYGEFKDERLYFFQTEFFTSLPEELCPICSFQTIRDRDLKEYLLATVIKEKVAEEIKEKFSSFQDFSTFLREKGIKHIQGTEWIY